MSLQWVSAAAFLYVELGLGCLLSLPFLSNYRWQVIFNSRLLGLLKRYGNFYFSAFILILFVLFLDSVHQMRKYSDGEVADMNILLAGNQQHMKLFRAQRNCYISGFSLFMLIVLRRLITLISRNAQMEASHEAVKRQAEGASTQCKKLMDEISSLKEGGSADDGDDSESKELLREKTEEIAKLKKELRIAEKDVASMKTQSKGLHAEYDRVVAENEKLQKLVMPEESTAMTKKDN